MRKLWTISLAFGGPEDGMVVISMKMGGLQEMAVAQAVSDVYRQTGTKLPLMGVNARELTREYLAEALRLMDEEEENPPAVVSLPRIVGGVMQETTEADLSPVERGLFQASVRFPYECPSCGASGIGPGPCTVCGDGKVPS